MKLIEISLLLYRTTANTCCQLWLCLGKLWKFLLGWWFCSISGHLLHCYPPSKAFPYVQTEPPQLHLVIIAHYSFHCLPFTRKKRFLHIIFWIILVSFCWVCISLLPREWEHPQWDTVSHCGLQFDLLDTLLLMLGVWFVLFTGRAFCWLLSSLVSACPFHKASPQQLLFECQGLAQPSAEHHTSLIQHFSVISVFRFIKDQFLWGSACFSVCQSLLTSQLLQNYWGFILFYCSDHWYCCYLPTAAWWLPTKILIGSLWDQQSRQFHDIWWTINPQLPNEMAEEISQKS